MFRIITGTIVAVASAAGAIYGGFAGPSIDFVALVFGGVGVIIGLIIVFNKKEDEIEEIKK